jgi:tRNA pseudouridine38-40 synthase
LTGVESSTTASGRTDAGVHALGQVVHFYTASRHDPGTFVKALNAMLPQDVRVKGAWEMPQSFHATLDAKAKLYRYVIDNGRVADPFQTRYAWHVFAPLDAAAMHRAAQSLRGRHDFHSFETNWPNRTSSVRTITHVAVNRVNDLVWVDVEADGFLYNMVRSIAGTLVEVGKGKWPESRVASALAAEDRREAGPTAPPQGLFLVRVRYS